MLSGLTTQDGWRDIGYEVEGQFLSGHQVTLRRPPEHSPNPMPELWPQPLFAFDSHASRADELAMLVENVRANLGPDGLKPSRELLVVVLGEGDEANVLQRQTATALMEAEIPVFIPTALGPNQLNPRYPNHDPDKFWHEGAVTVSLIHRAKGNEAEMVHVVGLDRVARREDDIQMRNQLFVALSRARGWVSLSGVGEHELNDEVRRVLESEGTYRFTFRRPPRRDMVDV
jgi:superfamily I DNA and RNA helicase